MKRILFIYRLVRQFFADEMPVYAASAAFWILISAVPFLMTLMTAIQFVPGIDKASIQEVLIRATPDMPQFANLIYSVTDNLFVTTPTAVLSLSVVATVWSASTGVYGIEKGIRKIYGTRENAGYLVQRISAMIFTVVFVIALLGTLLLLVLGSSIQRLVDHWIPLLSALISFVLSLKLLIAAGFLFAAFLLIYHLMPGRAKYVHRQLPGALFSTAAWMVFSYLFSVYFTNFRNISYMYGSLGALVLLMLWIYIIICIVFLGAELNAMLAKMQTPVMPPEIPLTLPDTSAIPEDVLSEQAKIKNEFPVL